MANYLLLEGKCSNAWIPVHVFFSTWFIYQMSRWTYHRKSHNPKINRDAIYRWLDSHEAFTRWSIIISAIMTGISFIFLPWPAKSVLVVLGVVSFLYPLPLLPFKKVKRVRDIPLLKILLIAFVWSSQAVLLSAIDIYGPPHWLTNKVAFLWMSQFVFILFITIPFDIKDLHVDKVTGVTTLPRLIGGQASKHLVAALGLIYIFLLTSTSLNLKNHYILMIAFLIISLIFRTYFLKKTTPKWRIMLIYDGSMIWYFLFLLFARLWI